MVMIRITIKFKSHAAFSCFITSGRPTPTRVSGTRSRSWPSRRPASFQEYFNDYYSNEVLGHCWPSQRVPGPAYQVTSQLNIVRPGGRAQQAQHDYHLGVMTNALRTTSCTTLPGAYAAGHCRARRHADTQWADNALAAVAQDLVAS